jgi:hypothetical protein
LDKVKISERALIQRINRKLGKESKSLKTARKNSLSYRDTGRYFIVDEKRNVVVKTHVDLGQLGVELKVLKPFEKFNE